MRDGRDLDEWSTSVFSHLMRCAMVAQNKPGNRLRIIDKTLTQTVGDLTVIVDDATNDIFISGTTWQCVLKPTGELTLTGKIDNGLTISQHELLTLLIAASTSADDVQLGEIDVRFYERE